MKVFLKFRFVFLILATVYMLVCMVGCISQRDFVWPMSVEESVDRPVPPGARLHWVETEQNGQRVEGWFFPGKGLSELNRGPAIIFFHGNNEQMDHCLEFPEVYTHWGISVLLVEYRGYGRSGGLPGRLQVRKDMLAFLEYLRRQPEVDQNRIIYQGRSIGGAVAADLAALQPPAAMILSSTFTSMKRMYWRYGIPGWIAADKYDTVQVLKNADYPVLVMHGRRDNIIPVKQGRNLGSLGSNTQYVEFEANHDLPVEWKHFEQVIREFLVNEVLVTTL